DAVGGGLESGGDDRLPDGERLAQSRLHHAAEGHQEEHDRGRQKDGLGFARSSEDVVHGVSSRPPPPLSPVPQTRWCSTATPDGRSAPARVPLGVTSTPSGGPRQRRRAPSASPPVPVRGGRSPHVSIGSRRTRRRPPALP